MRRMLIVIVAVLAALLIWLQWGPGRPGSRAGGSLDPAAGQGAAPELRIEIRETAQQANARQAEILTRFGNDPAALAWVGECIGSVGSSPPAMDAEMTDAWTRACWRQYAEAQASGHTDSPP